MIYRKMRTRKHLKREIIEKVDVCLRNLIQMNSNSVVKYLINAVCILFYTHLIEEQVTLNT